MKQEQQKKSINRLNRIEGQIRGLKKMIEEDAYCIDVINQTSSIRSALKGFEDSLLEQHLSSCVVSQIKNGKEKKAVDEIIKVYKLKR
ncbi:MAG: metal-sensing transcriptional repressor [Candidatus Pacebacteria bacterium]|nr:metal-sensing transcriptional repressor [Candidatus Paceibacterota bacterium]